MESGGYGYGSFLSIAVIALIASPMLVFYLRKWQLAFLGCLLYIPISGYIAILFDRNPLAVQAKDFFFLVPAYLGFSLYLQSKIKFSGIPRGFTLAAMSLLLLVMIQLVNPSPQSPGILAGMLGIKIWTFYLPLIMMSYIYVSDPKNFIRLIRVILVSSWIPATAGLAQYYASTIYGFEKVMKWWYGDEALAVSFGYGYFETTSGVMFRIPSTFSFITQYSFFLLAAFCFSLIALEVERSRYWKMLTYATVVLLLVACVTSGARFLLFSCPLALVLYFFLKRGLGQALLAVGGLLVFNVIAAFATGFNAIGVANNFSNLFSHYLFEFIPRVFSLAVIRFPLGAGTGAATAQVRHLTQIREVQVISIEGYFAKAIVELGIPGFAIVCCLLFIPFITNCRNLFRTKDTTLRAILSSLAVYQFLVIAQSLKGNPLDQDPSNVFFWISVGISFRLNAFLQFPAPKTIIAAGAPRIAYGATPRTIPVSEYPSQSDVSDDSESSIKL